jgi:signal transduction histidine kinase
MGVWHQGAGEQFTALVEAVRNMSLDAKSGPIGEVVSGRAPRNGYLPDERIHLPPELAAGIRTVLWAPVSTTNGVAAILEFFSGARVDLDDPLVDVLCGVGDQLGRVIERERSHRLLMQAERLVSVGTFAAGIAHEVNNPLSSVLLTARFAQKILDRPDEVQQLLEEIVQDAERCGRIVRSVSKFARNDSSDKAMIDLQAAIRAARLLVLGQAKRANVALVMNLMDQPLWMLGNQIEIEQALVNLLHNSLQASSPDNNIEIRSGKLAGFLQVQVQDHGCGMDDHTLRHAFDPFYSTRTQQGGTGLGLSLVHGLVRDHKGFIDIQSTVGKGTRVTLRFPEAAPGAAALNQRSEYRKRGSAYIFEP